MSRLVALAPAGEVSAIDRALEDVSEACGRVIVIEGAAGVGKSALLGELAAAAAARHFRVGFARAGRQDHELQGGPLRAALAGLDTAFHHAPLSPSLLDGAETMEPFAVLLDDAHRADELSLRTLTQVAKRVRSRGVLLAIALRPHLLDGSMRRSVEELSGLDHAARITLRPLTREAADELIRELLPDAPPAFCEECAELTGENPFLLNELLAWINANHFEPRSRAPAAALKPVPPRPMRQFVLGQLEELGPECMEIATAIALADRPLSLADAAQVAGLLSEPSVEALDRLLESGLLSAGEPLTFAASMTADCLRAEAPSGLAADLRRRAAELTAECGFDNELTRHHLLLAPPTGDARVVQQLVELADHAVSGGNPDEASVLIRRALGEDVGDRQAKSRLLVRLGHVNLLQGHASSTASLATGVAGLDHNWDRADALLKLGIAQVAAGSPRDASLTFAAAGELAPAGHPLRARAEVQSAFAGLLVPERRSSAAARIEALNAAPEAAAPRVAAELQLARAWQRLGQAAPCAEVADMTRRAVAAYDGGREELGGYFETVAVIVLALADDFAGATSVCDGAARSALAAGSVLARRNLELARALTLLHSGRVRESVVSCTTLLGPDHDVSRFNGAGAVPVLAAGLYERDESAAGEMLVHNALESMPQELPQLLLLEAKARLCLDRGQLAAALGAIHEAKYLADSLGIANPAVVSWQPLAALCYTRLGDVRHARDLIADAVEIAEAFGAPRARAQTLRVKARFDGGAAGLRQLEQAHSMISVSGAALEQAKVLVEYGAALHRTGRDQAARACLRQGIDLADRLGARRVSRWGLAALLSSGGRPRRMRTTGPAALTPAERRVVKLASAGATNREIADMLVVTRKTVEWHLSKAFVKLNVRSREQLSAVMDT